MTTIENPVISSELSLPSDKVESGIELLPVHPVTGRTVVSFALVRAEFKAKYPNAKSEEIKKLVANRMAQFRPIQDALFQKFVASGASMETRILKNGDANFKMVLPKATKESVSDQLAAAKAQIDRLTAERNAERETAKQAERALAKYAADKKAAAERKLARAAK